MIWWIKFSQMSTFKCDSECMSGQTYGRQQFDCILVSFQLVGFLCGVKRNATPDFSHTLVTVALQLITATT